MMNAFVRVVETGSFTKAAGALGVSRATISVSVQQLEEQLGVRLLHRTTRRVSLTSEGQLYHEKARDVLAKLDSTEQLFRDAQPRLAGRLAIDAPTRIARRVIIPALPEFLARHPGLEIHLGASDRTVNLVEKGVDAVVRVGLLRDSSHIARPLGAVAQVNCASPRYLARYGQPAAVDDLDEHVVVNYAPNFAGVGSWDYVVKGEERSRPMRSLVTVDNAETYIAACLAGLGLIQIPIYDVRHHLDSGALVAVMPRYLPPALPISLVYPSRKQVPQRLKAFATWVTEVFKRHGMLDLESGAGRPERRRRTSR
ncbi:LysR family transcriptional regulator [Labilithrix luteola]|uniref:LysR family transcriptional regulator n=1 Tax=Labilithrix luteola TaxID=1391654 RepID=A0A0K1Q161_9BACT|nr:LysR family transcriptional regulator [Labilithrix luteola]